MIHVAKRLLHGLLLLIGISLLSFVFAELAPGDYFSEMRTDARVSPETLAGLRAQYGLEQPLPVRYGRWVRSVLHGDFGYSLAYQGPVAPLLRERVRGTLLLTITATFLAWIVALPLGIWQATQRGTWRDGFLRAAAAFLLTIPELLLAIVLLVRAAETGWLPVGGMLSPSATAGNSADRARDIVWHMVLPVAVLVWGMLPVLLRHIRATMGETLDAPFAVSARAHGIPRLRLLYRHLLPAAMNPLVSLFGFSLGTLPSASLLVEVVTGWPGIGPLFLDAIMARDFAVVVAVVVLSASFLIAGNLAADLILYRIDPRIRAK